MSSNELLRIIGGIISSSLITALVLISIFIKSPEKIEKWVSMFLKVGAYFNERMEKGFMATNIQSTVCEKRRELGIGGDVLSYGIQIKWTDQESAEVDLKENKVIVMMRPFRSQAQNLANVVSLYVPRALLPKSRRYIDPDLITGIDYTVSKTFLEDNPTALNYFLEREIEKHTEEVRSFIDLIEPIHSVGRLTRIIIPEFQSLSGLHPMEPNLGILNETTELVRLSHEFETVGPDENINGIFFGEYIKAVIVPVGKGVTLSISGTTPHLDFIKKQIGRGIQHVYIVSAGRNNMYAKELVGRACRECNLSIIFNEEYKGKFRGRKRNMYCALLTYTELG